MGRIRIKAVKRAGQQLNDKFKLEFKADFQSNKSKVSEFAQVGSKKLRNKIAGYVTRLVKIGARKPRVEVSEDKAETEA